VSIIKCISNASNLFIRRVKKFLQKTLDALLPHGRKLRHRNLQRRKLLRRKLRRRKLLRRKLRRRKLRRRKLRRRKLRRRNLRRVDFATVCMYLPKNVVLDKILGYKRIPTYLRRLWVRIPCKVYRTAVLSFLNLHSYYVYWSEINVNLFPKNKN
jgi:hypothetical protein